MQEGERAHAQGGRERAEGSLILWVSRGPSAFAGQLRPLHTL